MEWLQQIGVPAIKAHRQPLIQRLQKELPALGFEPMTPLESTSPLVAFAIRDTKKLAKKLTAAKIDIAVYPHRIRVSPSLYNDQNDVDALLHSLQ